MGDNIERFTDEEKHDISVAVNVIINEMLNKHKGAITSTILNSINDMESKCINIDIFDLIDLRNMDGFYGQAHMIKDLIKRHPELSEGGTFRYFTTDFSIPISDEEIANINLSFMLKLYDYEDGGMSMTNLGNRDKYGRKTINATVAALGNILSSYTYIFTLSHEIMHLMFDVYDINIDDKFSDISEDMKYIIEECVCDHFAFILFMQKVSLIIDERIEKLSNLLDNMYGDNRNKHYYIRKELLDLYVKDLKERYNNN